MNKTSEKKYPIEYEKPIAVIHPDMAEKICNQLTEINLQLKKVVDDVEHICLTCGTVVKAPIFGLFDKKSGGLVNIMQGHEEPYVCRPCKKRIELLKKEEKSWDLQ